MVYTVYISIYSVPIYILPFSAVFYYLLFQWLNILRGIIKVSSSKQSGTMLWKLCCWKSRGWGCIVQSKATPEPTANSGWRYCSIAQPGNNKESRLALLSNAWPASSAKTKVHDLKAGGRLKLRDCKAGTILFVRFVWIKLHICGDLQASLVVVFAMWTSLNKNRWSFSHHPYLVFNYRTGCYNLGRNHCSMLLHSVHYNDQPQH